MSVIATGTDGNQAVILYRNHQPDLISLDISMPVKDGMEACREIMNEFPDANILITTAVRGDEVVKCISYGAKAYIFKPLKFFDTGYVMKFKDTVESIFHPEHNSSNTPRTV